MPSWVDGQPAAAVNLQNRGLAYGDGLFETIAVRGGRPSLLDGHLARLALGCQRLAISADLGLVRDELQRYANQLGNGVAKLILTRGDSQRGYAPLAGVAPRRILQGSPLPSYPVEHAEQGVRLYPCQTRRGTTAASRPQTPQPPGAGTGPSRMAGQRTCRRPDA